VARGDIQLIGLSKRFEDVTAVDGIEVHVRSGEFFSLLGPSGCGKTTTLRLIAGFEQPTSGRILLDGNDVARTPPHKRNVNTVFQNYALFPHLDVYDNIAFGLRRAKRPKNEVAQRVREALELVRMSGFEKQGRHRSRAASSSGSRSPARSCSTRRSCSSTSLSARSTRSCARRSRSS